MVDAFKKWLSQYPEFQEPDRKGILDDAIRCYQNDIPRAALLLTYNAFLDAIRNKILKYTNIPHKYASTPTKWNDVLRCLRDDEKFESKLNELFNVAPSDSIFDYSSRIHLREDIQYWKRRRNDCAHCKNSTITLSNVCALWSFIMDNYIFFNLEGTMERCINDYALLFNPIYTKPGSSDDKIFPRLCDAIRSIDDVAIFFSELQHRIPHSYNYNQFFEIIHKLLFTEKTKAFVLGFLLKQQEFRMVQYLEYKPEDVSLVYFPCSTDVRKMWKTDTKQHPSFLRLFISMIESNMIPEDEIQEAIQTQLQGWFETGSTIPFSKSDINLLSRKGFVEIFEKNYTSQMFSTDWKIQKKLCCKTDFFWSIISNFGISENMGEMLIDNYSQGGAFPYPLRNLIIQNYESVTKNIRPVRKDTLLKQLEEDQNNHPYNN